MHSASSGRTCSTSEYRIVRELAQMPVVRQDDLRSREPERMQVRVRDDRLLAVGDPANVGDEARRRELPGQRPEIAVERRQRRRPVRERLVRPQRPRIPGLHPEPAEVQERVHHLRVVGLGDQALVRIEEKVPHRKWLTQVCEHPTHAAIVVATRG